MHRADSTFIVRPAAAALRFGIDDFLPDEGCGRLSTQARGTDACKSPAGLL